MLLLLLLLLRLLLLLGEDCWARRVFTMETAGYIATLAACLTSYEPLFRNTAA